MRISDWSSDVCSSDLTLRDLLMNRTIFWFVDPAYLIAILVAAMLTMFYVRYRHPPERQLDIADRSEEHTSELQSLMRISYAVFCLKKQNTPDDTTCSYHLCSSVTRRATTNRPDSITIHTTQ